MRTAAQIISKLLSVAKADERIRAVILNGSRTNKKVIKDEFQDFDVIFLVENIASYKADLNWIDTFGERIMMQMPNSLLLDETDLDVKENEITYLMLFKDFNRIDLNLINVKEKEKSTDSLNKILLDKDNLLNIVREPNDEDYWVKKPSQKTFSDCCNEFWWVSTYVVKGLARAEPFYAKDMLEVPVRKMFMKMLAWYVGSENGFSINLGKSNRFLKSYVSAMMWSRIMKTYPNAEISNIWNSLMEMKDIFHEISVEIADKMGLIYNTKEAENVMKYLQSIEQKIIT